MVKYQRNRYRSWISNRFTQSKINLWFIVIGGLIWLIWNWLVDWLSSCFANLLGATGRRTLGTTFSTTEWKKRKRKSTLVKFEKNNTWYWFRNLGVVAWAYFLLAEICIWTKFKQELHLSKTAYFESFAPIIIRRINKKTTLQDSQS